MSAADRPFLAAILDSPDDDAPRLVYADWLDEQGDHDRAEFIRLDIRLTRMSAADPDRPELSRRVAELRQPNFQAWVDRLPQFPGVHWELFSRGFISVVKFAARKLFQHAPGTSSPPRRSANSGCTNFLAGCGQPQPSNR